jgi:hypothetical protein
MIFSKKLTDSEPLNCHSRGDLLIHTAIPGASQPFHRHSQGEPPLTTGISEARNKIVRQQPW